MATKSDFTEPEWKAMQKGVTGSGMLVSVSDRDFSDSFGEASAMAKALASQRESQSELVRDLARTHGTGFGISASRQEVESETLASIGVALAALASKAPDESDSYREFVLGVAEAKGGISPDEQAVLERIRESLATG